MDNALTFLVPHAGSPVMLAASLASIRLRYPLAPILVGLRGADPSTPRALAIATLFGAEYVVTAGNGDDTDQVMVDLISNCETPACCYMEADVLLMRRLDDAVEGLMELPAFIGVEEIIPWPEGRPGLPLGPRRDHFRWAPGFHTASFWLLSVQDFVARFGTGCISTDRRLGEPYYGLSLTLRQNDYPIFELGARFLHGDYGFATLYGDVAVHKWFGAWRLRDNVETASGVPIEYLQLTEANLLIDFWTGALEKRVKECMAP